MKYLISVFLVLLLMGCKEKSNAPIPEKVIDNPKLDTLSWLVGSWERIDEKEGNKTYEYWKQNNSNEFIGMGCTLKGLDTVWREDVLLAKDAHGWKFEVVGLGDTVSTIFRITQIESNKFVCENDLNEFPKKIEYAFIDDQINAVISGGGPTIPFNFKRMKH